MERNENLRDIELTHEEAVEYGRKGGKASVEARRKKKLYREIFESLSEETVRVTMPDASERRMTFAEAECLALHRRAIKGDTRAMQLILELTGELKQTLEVQGTPVVLLADDELKTIERLKK